MLVVVFTFYCHSYLPLECTDNVGRSPVNRNDLKELIPLLREEDLPADTPVYADKGYATEENRAFLTLHHLRDCIMHKAYRNRPLSQAQHLFNRSISPIRSVIERTFGSIRRWFDGGRCRYRGLAKTHTQNILESIAFNLYRTPGLIISKCVKYAKISPVGPAFEAQPGERGTLSSSIVTLLQSKMILKRKRIIDRPIFQRSLNVARR